MLTNNLKISGTTKSEFFELIFFQTHQKIWQKYCPAELSTVLEPLTCWLPTSVLTQGFLGIQITKLFPAWNFRDKSPVRLILFSKVFKILLIFWKWRKNWKIVFRFQDNCIWISGVKHSLLLRENTFNRVSIC